MCSIDLSAQWANLSDEGAIWENWKIDLNRVIYYVNPSYLKEALAIQHF